MGGGTFGEFAQAEEGKRTGQRHNHGTGSSMKTVLRRVRGGLGWTRARVWQGWGENYHDVINPGSRAQGQGEA